MTFWRRSSRESDFRSGQKAEADVFEDPALRRHDFADAVHAVDVLAHGHRSFVGIEDFTAPGTQGTSVIRAAVTSQLGQAALVFDVPGELSLDVQRRIWTLSRTVRSWPHVREAIVGMNNLTVIYEWKHESAKTLGAKLEHAWNRATPIDEAAREPIDIPVRYGGDDGPDLPFVAQHAGMSELDVISLHSAAEYVVFFLGFQPGFAYLGGLDPRIATPRRTHPRPRVPAGSVGIGGEQTGVYPIESPGGWQLIGRTEIVMFDPTRAQPSLLAPGDRVRFVPVS
jgi:KipI family sensor histidine kinase inhibitor